MDDSAGRNDDELATSAGELLRVEAGELTADEIIDALDSGSRVIITVELFGSTTDIALRHDGGVYYCDTPTRLHKHGSEAEMRSCIERMGYGRTENDGE